ncbi:MAG: NHL repeat-containing protein [Armatimonadota bacterium]
MSTYERFEYLEIEDSPVAVCDKHAPAETLTLSTCLSARRLVIEQVIGKQGSRVGEFNCPAGLAVDRLGTLYVADSYNHRIQKITTDGKVTAIGSKGPGPGRFINPQDIVVDNDLTMYVLEQGNNRLQKITSEGRLDMIIGRRGRYPGEFASPMGMALDHEGSIYVADTGNSRLQKLGANGLPLFSISSLKDRLLYGPQGVDTDSRGNTYVADTFSHCIVKFDPMGREISRFGCRGHKPGMFDEPQDLAVDSYGYIYVIEMGNNRLQVFDTKTACTECIDGCSAIIGGLQSPTGIAIGPSGEVYIADTIHHRVIRMSWKTA